MRREKRHSIFNKKMIMLICLVALIIIVINTILSRYASRGTGQGEIEVAFYLLGEDFTSANIKLFSMKPQVAPYVKTFSVSNNDTTKISETSIEYDLTIITTTNLPLTYELYLNENYNSPGATNIITTRTIEQDDDYTYFQTLKTAMKTFGHENMETNTYNLVIYFPELYAAMEYENVIENVKILDYQNMIESIEIVVNSRQII